ncbi:hypothetical protein MtrunA17_Chr5g0426031 [Medicago truncatula]|uniref:Uncharacterized protein n=1 Tax=Medicago truncatula TaxID=3880 RepID=A0A396HRZ5_MEDTR|nr:hypothetical protein MtrunA17_Chr5g0426031 [Medicago truncatula]
MRVKKLSSKTVMILQESHCFSLRRESQILFGKRNKKGEVIGEDGYAIS